MLKKKQTDVSKPLTIKLIQDSLSTLKPAVDEKKEGSEGEEETEKRANWE